MANKLESACGALLITGSILLVLTMVLHPVGGNFEHLSKISTIIIVTHSIALLSVPFFLLGFWGLTQQLKNDLFFSMAAFMTISIGMFAAVCAAALNGLALPLFISEFQEAAPETIVSIKPIITYNTALNHAFDFIFIGAACIATVLWSIAVLRTNNFPRWIAYFGIALSISAIVALVIGFVLVDLTGFRLFILGFVAWVISVGFLLGKKVN